MKAKLKVGDKVKGDNGYTFDPIEGVIDEIIRIGVYGVRITQSHKKWYINKKPLWGYNENNLTLLKTKIKEWRGLI